jgi:hypothetical protein
MSFAHFDDYDGDAPIDVQHFSGGFVRGQLDRLRLLMSYEAHTNIAEDLRLLVNGSLVAEKTITAGERGHWLPVVSLSSYGATTPLSVEFRTRTREIGEPPRGSRISITLMEIVRSSPATATLPTASTPEESATWATTKSRLNSLCAIAETVYNRIQADGETWNKARLFRRNYGYDDPAKLFFESQHIALVWNRVGARLKVRGRNVRLGYGGQVWTLNEPRYPDGTLNLKNAFEENLIDQSGFQTRIVYLDGLKALGLGSVYNVRGELTYAAEYLL